ncbi:MULTISPECIES: hypothetical protein [unclassified Streptomyces]|uniref:hypothetical protein n=1 Tax=unclassified Streptomyces TaxID=2593676 RepID=UPI002DD85D2D|nr:MULTISPECIES: hypothetical protein [unclassified Streptomyces]WSD94655.1 hypothetical protein OG758_11150 [Streptomyces sp. NBC_01474]
MPASPTPPSAPPLAADADRRQSLAELFPPGQLTSYLSPFGDEVLGWAIRYA